MCCLSQLGSTASLRQRAAWVCSASGGTGLIINNVNKAIKTNVIFPKVRPDAERRHLSVTERAGESWCEKSLYFTVSLHVNTEKQRKVAGQKPPQQQQQAPVDNHFIKQWLDASCNKCHLSAAHTHTYTPGEQVASGQLGYCCFHQEHCNGLWGSFGVSFLQLFSVCVAFSCPVSTKCDVFCAGFCWFA